MKMALAIDIKILDDIRQYVVRERKGNAGKSWKKISDELSSRYGDIKSGTLFDYCRIVGGAPDYVYGAFRSGRLTYNTMRVISQIRMSESAKILIARKAEQHGLTCTHIKSVCKLVKKGMAMETALQIVLGKISENELKSSARSDRSTSVFGRLSDDLILDMSKLITKLTIIEEMIPETALNKESVKSDFIRSLWFFCDAVSRTNDFLKDRVKRFFEENKEFAVTEYLLGNGESRKEEKNA